MIYDAIVIGGGPAGMSAALVLGRARRSALLLDDDRPRNAGVEEMHGYLTRDGVSPAEFRRIAHAELARYPSVTVRRTHAQRVVRSDDCWTIELDDVPLVRGRTLLLCTGVYDQLPTLDGLKARWGHSVFVCPFCDGWEVRDRTIAIGGPNRVVVELAQELSLWSSRLVLCPEHDDLTPDDRYWIRRVGAQLHVGTMDRLHGPGHQLDSLEFLDGTSISCDALFISAPLRQHAPIVGMLGCVLDEQGMIAVNEHGKTSVVDCYAAGDAVMHVHQAIVAAASGVKSAIAITTSLSQKSADAILANRASLA